MPWFRGNTHAHTTNSDGDSSPLDLAKWYKKAGYNFLVITDHHFRTDVNDKPPQDIQDDNFILFSGEEIQGIIPCDDTNTNSTQKIVEVNAINTQKIIGKIKADSVEDFLKKSIKQITYQHALIQINHPNFLWMFKCQELLAVKNWNLLEIANMHPACKNQGDINHASVENIWDQILSTGRVVYGVASDDTHALKTWSELHANPGKGWIMVKSEQLDHIQILNAIKNGDFYATTGIIIDRIEPTDKSLSIFCQSQEHGCHFYFIGKNSETLLTEYGNSAVYKFKGDELYVRCRIENKYGQSAWVQPVFLK